MKAKVTVLTIAAAFSVSGFALAADMPAKDVKVAVPVVEQPKAADPAAKGEHHKMDLSIIRNAATALQATNPDLAAGLTKYADDEAKEELQKKDTKAEKEGAAEAKEEKEMKGQPEATIKLFKDSAAALLATHPDLAAGLTKSAERKEKRLKEKKEGKEDSEKGEAKEMKDKK